MEKSTLITPKPTIELCASPLLLSAYNLASKCVIVTDILRASSTIITALAHQVKQITVTNSLEKCLELEKLGFVTAGERDGRKLSGCTLGNSPLDFVSNQWEGAKIALTSTNGTKALLSAKAASTVLIGGFLNIDAIVNQLLTTKKNTLILCAGWKGHISPEDTLFGGALAKRLGSVYVPSDEVLLAEVLYMKAEKQLMNFLLNFQHTQRLLALGAQEDLAHCLKIGVYNVIPQYRNGCIKPQDAEKDEAAIT